MSNKKFSIALVISILAIKCQAIEINAKYPEGKRYYLAEFGRKLTLECEVKKFGGDLSNYVMEWWFDGVFSVEYEAALSNTHTIERANVSDAGTYQCCLMPKNRPKNSNPEAQTTVSVVFKPIVWMPTKDDTVTLGLDFNVTCKYLGNVKQIFWSFKNDSGVITKYEESDDHVQLFNVDGVQNMVLKVNNATYADRGNYTCYGHDLLLQKDGISLPGSIYIRVRSPYAVLIPFFGIVVEVGALLFVIAVYEFKRDKNVPEEDSDTEDERTKSTKAKDEDEQQQPLNNAAQNERNVASTSNEASTSA